MTIIQLEYLLAVANCGSFSAAAEKCFVTQPSLSMQIKNLEEELGIVLLDRTRKPVVPTNAGEAVLRQARETVKAFEAIREIVANLKNDVSGTLRLGIIPTIAPYLLHRLIPDFTKKYPKVDLMIREMKSRDIIHALRHDMLDAAIMSGGTIPDDIQEADLFNDRFFVYVSPDHPLRQRNNIRIEDIDPRRMLLLSEGNCLRDQILELCLPRKNTTRQYAFDCNSIETLMRIVDSTPNSFTVVPEMVTEFIEEPHRSQLKTLAKGAVSRKISIAVRRTYAKSSLIAALKESILTVAGK
ncbi:MAG TPA: hydrogen peroxide-inducible genes activator [Candidatus Alistipes pullicola]|nr:hydrogen peroxide-inducible genes activator [Candidatus Alistipes pullicola]